MGDRTNCTMTVYSCPPEQVQAVLDILDEYLQENDYGDYDGRPGVLDLGGNFGANEVSCGSSDAIATAMEKRAPGASYYVHEDPYADWLGSMNVYTPELGHFTAECDADGTPQFDANMVRKIILMDTKEERETALGDPWLEGALGALLPPKGERLVPALPECPRHGGEWGDDLTCQMCVSLVKEEVAADEHRVVLDKHEGTGLVYVVARPTSITFRCQACACDNAELTGRKVDVTTTGYWPTESEAHKAHGGYGIGLGKHDPTGFEIETVA